MAAAVAGGSGFDLADPVIFVPGAFVAGYPAEAFADWPVAVAAVAGLAVFVPAAFAAADAVVALVGLDVLRLFVQTVRHPGGPVAFAAVPVFDPVFAGVFSYLLFQGFSG